MNERQQKIERLGELWGARGEGRTFEPEFDYWYALFRRKDEKHKPVIMLNTASSYFDASACIAIGQDVFGPTFWINRYDSGFASVQDDSYISAREPDPIDALIAATEAGS